MKDVISVDRNEIWNRAIKCGTCNSLSCHYVYIDDEGIANPEYLEHKRRCPACRRNYQFPSGCPLTDGVLVLSGVRFSELIKATDAIESGMVIRV
jgi:hypothetical protein